MTATQPVRIHLGGALGRRFGAEWSLYVSSPAEAIRAIDVNVKGELRRYLSTEGAKRYYKVALARKDNLLDGEEVARPSGRADIYILPTVRGAKSGGAKILVGVALIALAFATGGLSIAAGGAIEATFLGGLTASLGASLILGGITQLLTPAPNFDSDSVGDGRGSNIFEGNASTVTQGSAVGLVYGRALVLPMPISMSFAAQDQAIVNSFAPQEYEIVTNPETGIVEYIPRVIEPEDNLPEA